MVILGSSTQGTASPSFQYFKVHPIRVYNRSDGYQKFENSDLHCFHLVAGHVWVRIALLQNMWCAGFAAAAKHHESIVELIEVMQESELPCFASGRRTADNVRKRFKTGPDQVLSLFMASVDAWTTRQYDYYQRILNGIL